MANFHCCLVTVIVEDQINKSQLIQYEILEKLLEFFRQRVSPLLHDAPQEGFFSGRKYTPVYEKRAKRKENNLLETTYLHECPLP